MSFEFYDTRSFEFYNTDSFEFYDANDESVSAVDIGEHLFFPPNWESSFFFRKIWNTGIIRTKTGIETRSALFTFPRKSLRFSFLFVTTNESNRLKRYLYQNLHKIWSVPYWNDASELTSPAFASQNILPVDTQHRNFEVGGLCVILSSLDLYEVGEIKSFDATSITLVDNLTSFWGTGVMAYPLLKCTMLPTQDLSYVTDSIANLDIELQEYVDIHITHNVSEIASETYLNYNILAIHTNYESDRSFVFVHEKEITQFLGVPILSSNQNETNIKFTNEYLLEGREEIDEFSSFFDVNKGRWGSFWISSEQRDIIITVPFNSDAITFSIDDIDWGTYWESNKNTGLYLNFRFPDGVNVQRKIISEPASGQITIDEIIGISSSSAELNHLTVSFLYLVRFDIDQLEMEYITDSIAKTKVTFITLPEIEI